MPWYKGLKLKDVFPPLWLASEVDVSLFRSAEGPAATGPAHRQTQAGVLRLGGEPGPAGLSRSRAGPSLRERARVSSSNRGAKGRRGLGRCAEDPHAPRRRETGASELRSARGSTGSAAEEGPVADPHVAPSGHGPDAPFRSWCHLLRLRSGSWSGRGSAKEPVEGLQTGAQTAGAPGENASHPPGRLRRQGAPRRSPGSDRRRRTRKSLLGRPGRES